MNNYSDNEDDIIPCLTCTKTNNIHEENCQNYNRLMDILHEWEKEGYSDDKYEQFLKTKAKITAILKRRNEEKANEKHTTPPRYDKVFFEGTEWLNNLDKEPCTSGGMAYTGATDDGQDHCAYRVYEGKVVGEVNNDGMFDLDHGYNKLHQHVFTDSSCWFKDLEGKNVKLIIEVLDGPGYTVSKKSDGSISAVIKGTNKK